MRTSTSEKQQFDPEKCKGCCGSVGRRASRLWLVALLVVGDPEHEIVGFLPGSVVCLERCGVDRWLLLWMLRPDLLVQH